MATHSEPNCFAKHPKEKPAGREPAGFVVRQISHAALAVWMALNTTRLAPVVDVGDFHTSIASTAND
jgi:hypothetical protein